MAGRLLIKWPARSELRVQHECRERRTKEDAVHPTVRFLYFSQPPILSKNRLLASGGMWLAIFTRCAWLSSVERRGIKTNGLPDPW